MAALRRAQLGQPPMPPVAKDGTLSREDGLATAIPVRTVTLSAVEQTVSP